MNQIMIIDDNTINKFLWEMCVVTGEMVHRRTHKGIEGS
jgi:hypothetical protein